MSLSPAFRPCYLIGLPGAGKTFFGEKLSKFLNIDFYDTDQWIEQQSSCSIVEIFTNKGEDAFRKWETEAIKSLVTTRSIIACGGGLPAIPGMMEILLKTGWVIWLDTDLQLIEKRLQKNLAHRPLLQPYENHLFEKLNELLKIRSPFYEQAHHREVILEDITDSTFEKIANDYHLKFFTS